MSNDKWAATYGLDFDEIEGLTESPDVEAARGALREAETGSNRTEQAIEESKAQMATLLAIRQENHFTQKIRRIMQAPRSA